MRINDDGTITDQFLPALDFDAAGNIMTTFYDRRQGGNGYRLFRAYNNSNGGAILANLDVSQATHTTSANWDLPNFIGDYHEVWNTQINGISTWISSWVGVNADTDSDIFLSPITP